MSFQLAQVNVARLRAPLESSELVDFVASLDPVNVAAEAAAGFVWRLQTDEGNATSVVAFEWDAGVSAGIIVNLSVWRDAEALHDYVYSPAHRAVLARRREWFEKMTEAHLALWWISEGTIPTTDEAEARVRHLRAHGPTPFAFTLRDRFAAPSAEAETAVEATSA